MKKSAYIWVIAIVMFFSISTNGEAAEWKFTDVPADHWANESIEWAVGQGLVKGYEDHTFRPNSKLTEAQFVTIMSRFFNPGIEKGLQKAEWLDAHYDYLKKNGIQLPGHQKKAARNQEMTRLGLAKALYASRGLTGNEKEIIEWMYKEHLSSGKGVSTDKYVDFGGKDGLKRAHVAAFFKKMDRLGYTTMALEYKTTELRGAAFFTAIEPFFVESGYTLTQENPTSIQATTMVMEEDMRFAPRIDIETSGDKLFIGNLHPKHLSTVRLTSETIVAFGVQAEPEELAKRLLAFASENENGETIFKYDDYTLHVRTQSKFIPQLGAPLEGCYIDVVKK